MVSPAHFAGGIDGSDPSSTPGAGITDFRQWSGLGSIGQVTSFGLDSAGEIYLTVADGRVLKLVPG